MVNIDELRGTPKGYTSTGGKHNATEEVSSEQTTGNSVPAEAKSEEKWQKIIHTVDRAEQTLEDKNTKNTYEVEIKQGVLPFSDDKSVEQKVSETSVESRRNGTIKSDYTEKSTETTVLQGSKLRTEQTQTASVHTYYANGKLKSENEMSHEHTVSEASSINVALGHTEAIEIINDSQKNIKLKRNGDMKEVQSHSSLSSNMGTEVHVDLHVKGSMEDPKRMREVRLMDTDASEKVLRVSDVHGSKSYEAEFRSDREMYTLSKKNKHYQVSVEEDDVNATKYSVQKDGELKEKEMGGFFSKILSGYMRRKADRIVRKATEKEQETAKGYFDSVGAKRDNVPMLSDYFEAIPANTAEIGAQLKQEADKKMEEKAQVTADALLQQKQQNGRIMAEKTGRGWKQRSAQSQSSGTNNENTVVSGDQKDVLSQAIIQAGRGYSN